MTMVSPEERISRIEGILEQINERQGTLERMLEERTSTIMAMIEERNSTMMALLERKADRVEVRLYLAVSATLFAGVLGLLGVLIAKL